MIVEMVLIVVREQRLIGSSQNQNPVLAFHGVLGEVGPARPKWNQ
jgi:hypothetical protein